MNAEPSTAENVSPSEIENLLATANAAAPASGEIGVAHESPPPQTETPRCVFPTLSSISEFDFRKLRARNEEFVTLLAGRISMHLGLEVGLQMAKLEVVSFQKFTGRLSNPTHLTILKLDPAGATCLLDIPPLLGLCMVDRELGGPALPVEEPRELGKMEAKVLSKIIELILNQWCGSWSDVAELRATVLKQENNGRFLKICSPGTNMFVLGIETKIGELTEQMQLAVPCAALEPLLAKFNAADEPVTKPAAAPSTGAPRWNPVLDEVPLAVTAEMPDVEVTARQLAELKPGDLIPLPAALAGQIRLNFGGKPKFTGTLGTAEGQWAVKIEQPVKA